MNDQRSDKGIRLSRDTVFGYRCPLCGQGNVHDTLFPAYETKVNGQPWTVRNALIGVCDACGERVFFSEETQQWDREARALRHERAAEEQPGNETSPEDAVAEVIARHTQAYVTQLGGVTTGDLHVVYQYAARAVLRLQGAPDPAKVAQTIEQQLRGHVKPREGVTAAEMEPVYRDAAEAVLHLYGLPVQMEPEGNERSLTFERAGRRYLIGVKGAQDDFLHRHPWRDARPDDLVAVLLQDEAVRSNVLTQVLPNADEMRQALWEGYTQRGLDTTDTPYGPMVRALREQMGIKAWQVGPSSSS